MIYCLVSAALSTALGPVTALLPVTAALLTVATATATVTSGSSLGNDGIDWCTTVSGH